MLVQDACCTLISCLGLFLTDQMHSPFQADSLAVVKNNLSFMTFRHTESSDTYTEQWVESTVTSTEQPPEFRIQNDKKKKLAFLSPALSDGLPIACHSVMLSLLTFPLLLIFLPSLFPSLSPRRWAFTNYLSPFSISSVLYLPISLTLSLHPAPTTPLPLPFLRFTVAKDQHCQSILWKTTSCACSTADTLCILNYHYYYWLLWRHPSLYSRE